MKRVQVTLSPRKLNLEGTNATWISPVPTYAFESKFAAGFWKRAKDYPYTVNNQTPPRGRRCASALVRYHQIVSNLAHHNTCLAWAHPLSTLTSNERISRCGVNEKGRMTTRNNRKLFPQNQPYSSRLGSQNQWFILITICNHLCEEGPGDTFASQIEFEGY